MLPLDPYRTIQASPADLLLMDTNRDRVVNGRGASFFLSSMDGNECIENEKNLIYLCKPIDDPYSPYYPGDEYVDWVGASLYIYGTRHPWSDNIIAPPGKFEEILNGMQCCSSRVSYSDPSAK
jgi:hypothetical protein